MLENAKLYDKDVDSSATRSWGTTTVINGTSYATGLFWQPLQNKEDPYGEIEESADSVQEGADLFALKSGKTVQYGICASVDGYKKGLLSLAATVATNFSDRSSFVAVFKVDNGWYYCCVRNDIILSDGDILFLKEEDAKEQFMSMLAVPDWGARIAPAEWGIADVQETKITELQLDSARVKLQKIKALRGPKLYAVVIVTGVVSFWIISTFIMDVLFAPSSAPLVVAPVTPKFVAPIKKVEEKPVIILPWTTIKNPEHILVFCYRDTMDLLKILPPGWKIGGINCTENGATTSWRREIGRIAWVDKAMNESGLNFSAKSISDDGNTLIASTYYKVSIINSPPEHSAVELRNIINDLFQTLDVPVSLGSNVVKVAVPNSTNSRKGVNEEKIFRQITFSFNSQQNPIIWKDLLTKFSGLTINNIKYDHTSSTWHYEGAIYVF